MTRRNPMTGCRAKLLLLALTTIVLSLLTSGVNSRSYFSSLLPRSKKSQEQIERVAVVNALPISNDNNSVSGGVSDDFGEDFLPALVPAPAPQERRLENCPAPSPTADYTGCNGGCNGAGATKCRDCDTNNGYYQASTGNNLCFTALQCTSSTGPYQSLTPPTYGFVNTANSPDTCTACSALCATCSGTATTCQTCVSPKVLSRTGNQCLANCPGGEYKNTATNQCATCNVSCTTCSGAGSNACTGTCPNGRYFTLVSTSGGISSGSCTTCTSPCTTCSATGSSACLSCSGSLYLDAVAHQCVASSLCPANTYAANNRCNPCDASCKTCSGSNANACTACPTTSFFTVVSGSSGTCTTCSTTAFCATCSETPTKCLSCTGTRVLSRTGNQCLTDCPGGEYKNTATNQCAACDASCTTCSGPGINGCTGSCPNGRFFTAVPVGGSSGSCTACNTATAYCATCSGTATSCLSCTGTRVLSGSTCVCPPGQYDNGGTCTPCHASCLTCNGGSLSQCTTCSGATFLSGASVGSCNACSTGCTACSSATTCSQCSSTTPIYNIGGTSPNQQCCSATCATCTFAFSTSGSSATCATCADGTYLTGGGTAAATCVAACPAGTFANSANNQCADCDPSCATCSGSGASECLTCSGTSYLDAESDQCVPATSCSSGTYANSATNECSSCDTSCDTCSGAGASACLTCFGSLYLNTDTDQCVGESSCPTGTYADSVSHECLSCDTSCDTCSGTEAWACLTCSGTSYLDVDTHRCVAATGCPARTYANSGTNQCTPCGGSCATCDGTAVTDCLSCSGTDALDDDGSCVAFCSDGDYNDDGVCRHCDGSCATCEGLSDTDCLTCPEAFFLDALSGTCVTASNCPASTYANTVDHECSSCDGTCATCSDSGASACLTCSGSLYLNADQCVGGDSCPTNTYADSANNECSSCDDTCETCSDSGASACLTCSGSLYLDTDQCVEETSCPLHTFANSANNECTLCHESCAACDGTGPTDCLTCSEDDVFDNGTCAGSCSADKYEDAAGICQPCDDSCATCNGPSSSECLSCSDPTFLDSSNNARRRLLTAVLSGTCVAAADCPPETFANSATDECESCDSSCGTCNGPLADECLTCPLDKFFNLGGSAAGRRLAGAECGTCVEGTDCPSGTYANTGTPNTCDTCDASCATCDGPASTDCLSCSGNNVLGGDGTCGPVSMADKLNAGICESNLAHPASELCGVCHGTAAATNTLVFLAVPWSSWISSHQYGHPGRLEDYLLSPNNCLYNYCVTGAVPPLSSSTDYNTACSDFTAPVGGGLTPAAFTAALATSMSVGYFHSHTGPNELWNKVLDKCCVDLSNDEIVPEGSADPWMVGFSGQRFFFDGEDGKWYNVVNDLVKGVTLNMRMSKLEKTATFIDGIGMVVKDKEGIDHTMAVQVIVKKEDFNPKCADENVACLGGGAFAIEVDGEQITEPGYVAVAEDFFVAAVNAPFFCKRIPDAHFHWEEQVAHMFRDEHRRLFNDEGVDEANRAVLALLLNNRAMFEETSCVDWLVERQMEGNIFEQTGSSSTVFIQTPFIEVRVEYTMNVDEETWAKHHRFDWFLSGYHVNAYGSGGRAVGGVLGETGVIKHDRTGMPVLGDRYAILSSPKDSDYEVDGAYGKQFNAMP